MNRKSQAKWLTRYNWSIPVAHSAKLLLDDFDGKNTLLELQSKYGRESLVLILSLYKEGLIKFV